MGARPAWWPRNPHGYVFLGEAIDQIGRATFQDWTGAEPDTEDVPLLPTLLKEADHWAKGHADRLLSKHCPHLPSRVFSDPQFTDEQWGIAVELARRIHDERQPSLARLCRVHDEILTACEAGVLTTAVRERDGDMRESPRKWWNGAGLETRLKRCKLNPDDPFGASRMMPKEDVYLWIFVTAGSLNLLLSRLGDVSAPSDQTVAILEAISNLWPKEIPAGIRAKERREKIAAWLKDKGRHVPPDDALDRAIQRAMKGAKKT
jgi:hypothetical protein